MKRTLLLFLFALLPLLMNAQSYDSVSGRVVDSQTGNKLYFASINLSGTNLSIVTNSEGFFTLKMPGGVAEDRLISISHLGYMVRQIPLSSFAGTSSEKPLVIEMTPVSLNLDPAVVNALDPEAIFFAAYDKVKDNYPTERVGMTSFYREMIKKNNTKYLSLNEAVIDIDKASYGKSERDRAAIYKGRRSLNYDSSDTLFVELQGGVMNSLLLDIVKNPFVGTTLFESNVFYDFTLKESALIDGILCYAIGFKQKPYDKEVFYAGTIYIDPETYAIPRVEFHLDVDGREQEAAKYFIVKYAPRQKFFADQADYVVNYKKYGDKWFFEYSRMDIKISASRRFSLFRNHYHLTSEMAVTDHKTDGFAIEEGAELVKLRDILSDKLADFEDEFFWESYNIIEPDQSIETIIRRIVRQLRAREVRNRK